MQQLHLAGPGRAVNRLNRRFDNRLRRLRRGDGAHERLVGKGEVQERHVERTPRFRHIVHHADHLPGIGDGGGGVAGLQQAPVERPAAEASPSLVIDDVRRAIDRREHRRVSRADHGVAGAIAGAQQEGARRRGADHLPQPCAVEEHPVVPDLRPVLPPQIQRLRIALEAQAGPGEDTVRAAFDDIEPLFVTGKRAAQEVAGEMRREGGHDSLRAGGAASGYRLPQAPAFPIAAGRVQIVLAALMVEMN